MRPVFLHKFSGALTVVPDAKEIIFTDDDYFIVRCTTSTGYFPRPAYRFLGIDYAEVIN